MVSFSETETDKTVGEKDAMSYGEIVSNDEWQAKEDARTLAQANVIKQDPDRLTSAKQAANVLAENAGEDAKAMKSVSSGVQVKEKTGVPLLTIGSTLSTKKYDSQVSSFLKGT